MMPFSYQGFGFTTILLMVAILSAGQLVKYLREKHGPDHSAKKITTGSSQNATQ